MQDAEFVRRAFARIANKYVVTNKIVSCGVDTLWRWRASEIVASHAVGTLLDVACGTGDLLLAFADSRIKAEMTGCDFCQPMLDVAKQRGLQNLVCGDAMQLPFADNSFDAVSVAFGLRNMADYAKALQEMQRVLRPGGLLLILDFSLPEGPLKVPYRWYLHKVLPKIAGYITGSSDAYAYLGQSIESFPQGRAMLDLLASVNYQGAYHERLSMGIASIYCAYKPN